MICLKKDSTNTLKHALKHRFLPNLPILAPAIIISLAFRQYFLLLFIPLSLVYLFAISYLLAIKDIKFIRKHKELELTAKTKMLEKLIEGTVPADIVVEVFETRSDKRSGERSLLSDYFSVILLNIVDFSQMFPEIDELPRREFATIDALIRKVFQRRLNGKHIAYFVPRPGGICIIMNIYGIDEQLGETSFPTVIEDICDTVTVCVKELEEICGLVLGAVLSAVYKGRENITKAYGEAVELLSYGELRGDPACVVNSYTNKREPLDIKEKAHRTELERQYHNFVSSKDFIKAGEVVDKIIESEIPSIYSAHQLKNRLVMRLEQLMSMMCIFTDDHDAPEFEVIAQFKRILDITTVDDIRRETERFFSVLDEYIRQSLEANSKKVEHILNFIHENYHDPAISAIMISDNLGISASYLSRILRQNTGMGIVDIIHTVRLEKAKELLNGTKMSIEEIAGKVGFTNRWTMNRSFKRYEGITPGTYREIKNHIV